MIGFNHAATGGLLAKYLPLPIAIPVAFASHFILDALPHYGIPNHSRDKSWFWRAFYIVDFVAAWTLGFVSWLVWHHPEYFLVGFIACSPDFLWVARVITSHSFDLSKNQNKFTKWHARIQKLERPWGIYLEIPLAVVLFLLVRP